MDLGERRCDGMTWIDLTQYRDLWGALVNMIMKFQVP
jgi:hypothetical protein